MNKDVYISLVLDKRRINKNKKYPVRLRIFTPEPRIQKLYPTRFEFLEKEFQRIYINAKCPPEDQKTRLELQSIVAKAIDESNKIKPFDFTTFESIVNRPKGESQNVVFKYQEQIKRLKSLDQIGTAQTYELSLKSLLEFANLNAQEPCTRLLFKEISPYWLERYEKYMTDNKKRSPTTISMYLRCLRAIFNNAIADKDIEQGTYPFGKRKYQIPAFTKVKKALDKGKLKALYEAKPKTQEQEKSKDFWFFSFFCNGINIKDIALLKFKDLDGSFFTIIRAKTKKTSKSNLKPLSIYLNKASMNILKKYANPIQIPESYVFNIIECSDTEIKKYNKIKNFTRFINQNLKKLAIDNGITGDISTYWARHSFATAAIRAGKRQEFVKEAFGHTDQRTTENYFAGFDDETKKEFGDQLMNFD